ncbi:MAG: hypothetical protein JNL61_13880, partial [Rhizobiaceae bacterium]|nr:hypothetical protein [Rhizobiaceae bacterium]
RVSSDLKRFTENTVRTPAQLRADLALIRQRGYSETNGEYRAGVLGYSTAIRSPSGEVIGAIGVAGPEERMRARDVSKTIAAVLAAGRRIEADLGFGPQEPFAEEQAPAARKPNGKGRRETPAYE